MNGRRTGLPALDVGVLYLDSKVGWRERNGWEDKEFGLLIDGWIVG
jgi:hypothetical protein